VQLPVTIALQPSRRLVQLLLFVHCAALVLLWPLSLPLPIRSLLILAVVVSAVLALRRARRPEVTALRLGKGGELEVATSDGVDETARVLPQTTVLPGLIVLLLRQGRRTRALTLPVDAIGAAGHRRLRLWLKWQVAPNPT
jgi:toxin CptA